MVRILYAADAAPRSFVAGRERQPSRTSIAPFVKQCLAGPSAYSARACQGRSLREGKRKPPEESGGKRKSRRLPIFPGRFQPSILGASGLNCRVRDGNGCTPTAIGTDYGDPYEIRTRVAGVRGRSLRPLDQRAIWCTIRDSNPGHPD